MPGKGCSGRKHTPIVSEKQRAFFGSELSRKEKGQETKTDMSKAELTRHLHEAKGKHFPTKKK